MLKHPVGVHLLFHVVYVRFDTAGLVHHTLNIKSNVGPRHQFLVSVTEIEGPILQHEGEGRHRDLRPRIPTDSAAGGEILYQRRGYQHPQGG